MSTRSRVRRLAVGVAAAVLVLAPAGAASAVAAGETEVVIVHGVPGLEVDILAGGAAALSGVTNGQTARIDVPGGTTVPGVGIAVPGSKEAALPVGDVTVPANTLVLAYAIGSGDGGSLRVVTAAVGVHTPSSVPSGSAGLASNGLPALVVALMALGALGIAAPAMAMRRR